MKAPTDDRPQIPSQLFFRNRMALLNAYEGAGGGADLRGLIMSTSPEIYLPLTVNPNDATTHARNATEHVTSGSIAYSSLGALLVAANSQYLSVPNWTTGYSTFSVGVIVRPVSLPVNFRIGAQRNAGTWFDWYGMPDGSQGIFDGTANNTTLTAAASLVTGADSFLGLTVSAGGITPYVNGVAGAPASWTANTSSDELEIGRLQATGLNFLDGRVRHFFITQQAVSAAQWAAMNGAKNS